MLTAKARKREKKTANIFRRIQLNRKVYTLPETNIAPEIGLPNRKVVFQPSIFRGSVSFREAI